MALDGPETERQADIALDHLMRGQDSSTFSFLAWTVFLYFLAMYQRESFDACARSACLAGVCGFYIV